MKRAKKKPKRTKAKEAGREKRERERGKRARWKREEQVRRKKNVGQAKCVNIEEKVDVTIGYGQGQSRPRGRWRRWTVWSGGGEGERLLVCRSWDQGARERQPGTNDRARESGVSQDRASHSFRYPARLQSMRRYSYKFSNPLLPVRQPTFRHGKPCGTSTARFCL